MRWRFAKDNKVVGVFRDCFRIFPSNRADRRWPVYA